MLPSGNQNLMPRRR